MTQRNPRSGRPLLLTSSAYLRGIAWCFILGSMLGTTACRKKTPPPAQRGPNTPSTITLSLPADFDKIPRVRDSFKVKFTALDYDGVLQISIKLNDQYMLWKKDYTKSEVDERTESFKLKVSPTPKGKAKLTIRVLDKEGNLTQKHFALFFDLKGPKIQWLSPSLSEVLERKQELGFTVEDESGLKSVTLYHGKTKLRSFPGPPYTLDIAPGDFPAGQNRFWIRAIDELGNHSYEGFSLRIKGARLGVRCVARGCGPKMFCVIPTGRRTGTCRRACRISAQCPRGQRCRVIAKYRVCMPHGAKVVRALSKEGESCSRTQACDSGLVCLRPQGLVRSRCYKLCRKGIILCKKNQQCRRFSSGVSVCLRRRTQVQKLAKAGEACSPQKQCVKGAICAGSKTGKARCYTICSSNIDCESPQRCLQVSGVPKRICIKPQAGPRPAGRYELCQRRPCARGYACISAARGAPRCHPRCRQGQGDCGGICARVGNNFVCLQRCDPASASCPTGTRCGFTRYGKSQKQTHYLCI